MKDGKSRKKGQNTSAFENSSFLRLSYLKLFVRLVGGYMVN